MNYDVLKFKRIWVHLLVHFGSIEFNGKSIVVSANSIMPCNDAYVCWCCCCHHLICVKWHTRAQIVLSSDLGAVPVTARPLLSSSSLLFLCVVVTAIAAAAVAIIKQSIFI